MDTNSVAAFDAAMNIRGHGILDPALLAHQVTLSLTVKGRQTTTRQWCDVTMSVRDLIGRKFLTNHEERPDKDSGKAFLQGPTFKKGRTLKTMPWLDIMVLDLDTGESREDVVEKLKALGLFGVVYSTFSNGKRTSTKGKKGLAKWAGVDEPGFDVFKAWLLGVKMYQPHILEDAEFLGTNAEGEVVIRHAPMTKMRVVMVLRERFHITGGPDSEERRACLRDWREAYFGVGRLLGAFVDRACSDVSRLYYGPSRPIGATNWFVDVVAGDLLDLGSVERVPLERGLIRRSKATAKGQIARDRDDSAPDDPFRTAARGMHAPEYVTANMSTFLFMYGSRFRIVDCVADLRPRWIRGDASRGKTVQCPGEDDHTQSGGSGCYAVNAGDGGRGFVLSCRHDSCADRDRADLLDLFCEECGITDAMDLVEDWCHE
jgi:hypothetical protein